MKPRIETLPEKKLLGKRVRTSLASNKTPDLWRSFMPQQKSILHRTTTDLISMRLYDASYDFKNFDPQAEYECWAAAEVSSFDQIPEGMEPFGLKGGLYAVFLLKGTHQEAFQTIHRIFAEWLPLSEYVLDNRPHFEVLGEKYKNNSPDSEEELYIPIKRKTT